MSQIIDFYSRTNDAEVMAELAQIERQEKLVLDAYSSAHARLRGVCLSGMEPSRPVERTQAQKLQAAREAIARRKEFEASPKGRLRAALSALSTAGYPQTASACINAYDRGVATGAIVHRELSFILHELTTVGGDAGAATRFAREACNAALELAFEPYDQEAA